MEQYFLTNPAKLRALVRAAAIQPAARVLELGAGGGTVAAALPPCALTLVELDEGLAAALQRRFPAATVLQEDAIGALQRLEFDVLFSNLPHALTADVLQGLATETFRRALVAVHEDDALEPADTLTLTTLLKLEGTDFTPPQPFGSKLILVTPKLRS